jgi:hypothetical protein
MRDERRLRRDCVQQFPRFSDQNCNRFRFTNESGCAGFECFFQNGWTSVDGIDNYRDGWHEFL